MVIAGAEKLALTDRDWFRGMVQVVAVPVQAPNQPPKVEPLAGVAVRVTTLPGVKVALQVAPQSMPAGRLVRVPVPDPVLARLNLLGRTTVFRWPKFLCSTIERWQVN